MKKKLLSALFVLATFTAAATFEYEIKIIKKTASACNLPSCD